MNLVEVKPKDYKTAGRNGEPIIRFYAKGQVHISPAAKKLLGFEMPDAKMGFAFDDDKPKDIYVFKSEDGFALRGKSHNDLTFSSAGWVKAISFTIMKTPTEHDGKQYFALATSAPIKVITAED